MRYFEWNYDTHEVVEYERAGECNCCGDCCRAVVHFVACTSKPEGWRASGETTDRLGVWAEASPDGAPRYLIKLTKVEWPEGHVGCAGLDVNNKCSGHATKISICAYWPFHPSHVTPFPHCSYLFKEVARWPIDD